MLVTQNLQTLRAKAAESQGSQRAGDMYLMGMMSVYLTAEAFATIERLLDEDNEK